MRAPYTDKGLESYPPGYGDWRWEERPPFHASLHLAGRKYGRSARNFIWEDPATGLVYPMFLTDLEELLVDHVVTKGVAKGTWDVKKRGTNYGIRLVARG